MSISAPKGQGTQPIKVGAIVENFGAVVEVKAEHNPERGVLVEIIPWVRNGEAQGGVGQRFYAAACFCKKVPTREIARQPKA